MATRTNRDKPITRGKAGFDDLMDAMLSGAGSGSDDDEADGDQLANLGLDA